MFHSRQRADEAADRRAASISPYKRPRPVRLLLVHNGDPRLAALDALLCDLGYDAVVLATFDDARALLDREGPPDVLITTRDAGSAMRGLVFARECLARFPALRAAYVSWLPWSVQPRLTARERVLPAPFTAQDLAAVAAAPEVVSVKNA